MRGCTCGAYRGRAWRYSKISSIFPHMAGEKGGSSWAYFTLDDGGQPDGTHYLTMAELRGAVDWELSSFGAKRVDE